MQCNLDSKIQQRLNLSDQEIAAFCQQWGIRSLALFGSILRDDFGQGSDIDLLIAFQPQVRQGLLTLARIKHALEAKLQRPVDIALKEVIANSENWIRREEILGTAQTIYDQG